MRSALAAVLSCLLWFLWFPSPAWEPVPTPELGNEGTESEDEDDDDDEDD